jgi:glutaminyl-peptide cyclotransferase
LWSLPLPSPPSTTLPFPVPFLSPPGLNGASTLRLVNATTGAVLASRPLPPDAFGEGVTRLPRRGDRPERLLQLTWLSGRAYLYNAANLSDVAETRTLLNDGWGAAYDPRDDRVVLSDGSSSLAWVHAGDPGGALLRHVSVTAPGGAAVPNLNELEWVSPRPGGAPVGGDGGPVPLPSGEVWANVWGTPCVARIDPANGAVVGWILADALAPRAAAAAAAPNAPPGPALDVLNGIAVVPETGRLLMTGKHWPLLFDVALEPGDAGAAARARAACVQPRVSFG